jgi:tetratricopeptide (TPR) repeat protein
MKLRSFIFPNSERFFLFIFSVSLVLHGFTQNSLEEVRSLHHQGYHKEALTLLREYLGQYPSTTAYYLESVIHESLGNNMQAISSLTEVIRLDVNHLEAHFKRAELFYQLGLYQEAISDLDYILDFQNSGDTQAIYFKIDPTGKDQVEVTSLVDMKDQVYGLRGLSYQAIGRFDHALDDLTEAIRRDSVSQNFVNRALLWKELNEFDQSRSDLYEAIRLDSNMVHAWYNLLLIEPALNLPEEILSDQQFVPLLTYQAVEAFQKGDLVLADQLFKNALKIKADDPLLLINAGRLSDKQGDYDQAIEYYRRCRLVEPDMFELLYLIANSLHKKGDYSLASSYYEQYLARDGTNEHVWYNAALNYRALDDKEETCRCLKMAMSEGFDLGTESSLIRECEL